MRVDHPDRVKWNAKYAAAAPAFAPHPLLEAALAAGVPDGPALELACGLSGNALALAASGRQVLAADVSDVALRLLDGEAAARRLGPLVATLHVDLLEWTPPAGAFALVLATRYWERVPFTRAAAAVAPGGLLAWEAFTPAHRRYRPEFRDEWCVAPGEPASLLPAGYTVLVERDLDDGKGASRRLLARRTG